MAQDGFAALYGAEGEWRREMSQAALGVSGGLGGGGSLGFLKSFEGFFDSRPRSLKSLGFWRMVWVSF